MEGYKRRAQEGGVVTRWEGWPWRFEVFWHHRQLGNFWKGGSVIVCV